MKIEQDDYLINGRHFNRVMAATIVVTIAFVVLAFVLLQLFSPERFGERPARTATQPDQVNAMHFSLFQAAPSGLALDAEKRRVLESYRWVDAETRRLSIPIDEAIELYLNQHQKGGSKSP